MSIQSTKAKSPMIPAINVLEKHTHKLNQYQKVIESIEKHPEKIDNSLKKKVHRAFQKEKTIVSCLKTQLFKEGHFVFNQKESLLPPNKHTANHTTSDGTIIHLTHNFAGDYKRTAQGSWLINGKAFPVSMEEGIELIYEETGKNKELTEKIISQLGQHQGNTAFHLLTQLAPENVNPKENQKESNFLHIKTSNQTAHIEAEINFSLCKLNKEGTALESIDGKNYRFRSKENVQTEVFNFDLIIEDEDDLDVGRLEKEQRSILKQQLKEMLSSLEQQALKQNKTHIEDITSVTRTFEEQINQLDQAIGSDTPSLKELKEKGASILQNAKLAIADASQGMKEGSYLSSFYQTVVKVREVAIQVLTSPLYVVEKLSSFNSTLSKGVKFLREKIIGKTLSFFISLPGQLFKFSLNKHLEKAYGTQDSSINVSSGTEEKTYTFRAKDISKKDILSQWERYHKRRLSHSQWKPQQHTFSASFLHSIYPQGSNHVEGKITYQQMGEFSSGITPINAHFDSSFMESHGYGGQATSDRKDSEHLINAWSSNIRAGNEELKLFRHGTFSKFNGTIDERKANAKKTCKELLKAALIEKIKENPGSLPTELNFAQLSLVSPILLPGYIQDLMTSIGQEERELLQLHEEALQEMKGPQDFEIIRNGKKETVHVNVNLLPFNLAINSARHLPGVQSEGCRINQPSLDSLTEIVNKSLAEPDTIENRKKKERIKQLSQEIETLFTHPDDYHVLELPSRMALLFHELGYQFSFNCKSGKDRTGYMVSRTKALFMLSKMLGRIPSMDELATPGPIRTALVKIHERLIEKEDKIISFHNTGTRALKSSGIIEDYTDVVPKILKSTGTAIGLLG